MSNYVNIRNSIEYYFKKSGISYGYSEEDGYFLTDFLLDDGMSLDYGIAVLDDGMVSYAMLPFEIPEPLYGKITEYITRANYGILSGNFEFDFIEGRVQYKTFLFVPEGNPSEEEVEALLMTPFAVITRYIKGIQYILKNPKINVRLLIGEIEG